MQEPRLLSFPHAPVTYIPAAAQGKTHCRRHSQMTTTTTTTTIAATVTPTAAGPADAASLFPCEEGDSGTVCVSVAVDWHYGTRHRPGWHPLSLGINLFTNLCLLYHQRNMQLGEFSDCAKAGGYSLSSVSNAYGSPRAWWPRTTDPSRTVPV